MTCPIQQQIRERISTLDGRPVIIESPYAGDRERNDRYLDELIRAVALEGGAPYASHRMLCGPLNDDDPAERSLGMRLGRKMLRHLSAEGAIALFGTRYGYSAGMRIMWEWLESSNLWWPVYMHEIDA